MAKRKAAAHWEDAILDLLAAPLDALRAGWQSVKKDPASRWMLLVMLFTLASRLWRPDWYSVRTFHPDERWIIDKTHVLSYPDLPGQASGDPAGLQYGSLPFYVVATAKDVARAAVRNFNPYEFTKVAGRTLTGLVDALSVLLLFLLAARLFNRRVALYAAAFLAFTPLHIQLSHFFTVDPWGTCFGLLTLYACARVKEEQSLAWSLGTGVALAAALSSKTAMAPLLAPVAVAHAWPVLEAFLRGRADKKAAKEARALLPQAAVNLGAAAGAAMLAFFIFMPLVRPLAMGQTSGNIAKFFRNQAEQQNILVKGSPEGTPFVRQYWDTLPGAFHIKNLVLYYQGLGLGISGLLGLLFGIGLLVMWALKKAQPEAVKPKRGPPAEAGPDAFPWALMLSFVLPYFFIVGMFSFAKFARYMLPITPLLALMAAAFLAYAGDKLKGARSAPLLLVLFISAGYGFGYLGTYTRTHPWIETSNWMLEGNVPTQMKDEVTGAQRRTRVYNETWGDDLPVDVQKGNAGSYHNEKINIVEWDSPRKLAEFGQALSQADVMVMADARAYGTYLRIPTRFPLTHAYFDLMFSDPGRLGFELAHSSHNRMRWMGVVEVNDSRIPGVPKALWADESFTLYDRPHAFLFRRKQGGSLQPAEIMAVLEARVRELGLPETWRQGRSPEENRRAAMAGPEAARASAAAQAAAGQGSPSVPADDVRANPNIGKSRGKMLPLVHPVLMWWVLSVLLGWLALPLCAKVFRNFPDGGYALSKALGLFLFSWLAFNLSHFKALPFYQSSLWILLAALLGLTAFFASRRRAEIRAWALARKHEIVWSEALFAGAFLLFVAVRSFHPNIHDIAGQGYFGGGEPLGMTYLSAVTRAHTFPLHDPWLALKDSSYYYFGYVMAGVLTKLSGFKPAVTYNLSLALFFALGVVTAWGVARALVQKRIFALAAAGAVACFGSLWSVAYIMIQAARGGGFSIPGFLGAPFSHGFIWDPTRFPELVNFHIFEFPYFSWLYGDLHPHNMVVAFGLLATGLLLVPFRAALPGWRSFGPDWKSALLWAALAALLIDAQWAINTWNWPVFVALSLGACLVGPWVDKRVGLMRGMLAALEGFGAWILILALGRGLMAVFRHYFVQGGDSRLGNVQPGEWQIPGYLPLAFFLFGLAPLALMGALRVRRWLYAHDKALKLQALLRKPFFDAAPTLLERILDKYPVQLALTAAGLGLSGLLVFLSLPGLVKGPTLCFALGAAVFCLTFFCLRGWDDGREAFLWMLGAFTMFLVAGSEIKFVADRMNTIFKFWFNGWVLMGLAFGAAFYNWFEALQEKAAKKLKPREARRRKAREILLTVGATLFTLALFFAASWADAPRGRQGAYVFSQAAMLLALALPVVLLMLETSWARLAGRGLFFALLFMGLLYPLGATIGKIAEAGIGAQSEKRPRLDGTAFMGEMDARSAHFDNQDYDKWDHQAISWLNDNADLTEVLLEAPGLELYRGFNRYAIYTGLPTLLGWKYQVGQQLGSRAGSQLDEREREALRIYLSPDVEEAKRLLRKYQVKWIVVGGIERKVAVHPQLSRGMLNPSGPDKFKAFCKVAYENQGAVIYRFEE